MIAHFHYYFSFIQTTYYLFVSVFFLLNTNSCGAFSFFYARRRAQVQQEKCIWGIYVFKTVTYMFVSKHICKLDIHILYVWRTEIGEPADKQKYELYLWVYYGEWV